MRRPPSIFTPPQQRPLVTNYRHSASVRAIAYDITRNAGYELGGVLLKQPGKETSRTDETRFLWFPQLVKKLMIGLGFVACWLRFPTTWWFTIWLRSCYVSPSRRSWTSVKDLPLPCKQTTIQWHRLRVLWPQNKVVMNPKLQWEVNEKIVLSKIPRYDSPEWPIIFARPWVLLALKGEISDEKLRLLDCLWFSSAVALNSQPVAVRLF